MLAHSPASIPNFLHGAPPLGVDQAAILTVDGAEFLRCQPALASDIVQDALAQHVADRCLGTFVWHPRFSAYVLRSATFIGGRA